MGLVQYALKFRITFYVMAVLMLLAGVGAIVVTPKDVLPEVNIPVVVIVWTYNGLSPKEMEQRITTYSEFSLSNNVSNVERMESTTLQGTAVEKVYFSKSVSIDLAISQVVSAMNSIRAYMPPGVQPPVVMQFSASAVPVIQLSLASTKESLTQIYNYAQYRIRQRLFQVPGSVQPPPYGGAPRQIMVDLDLKKLQALGLTPLNVTDAMNAQNLTVPSGLAKIGQQQYPIALNATPDAISTLENAPIKLVDGQPVLMRDVAWVRDGSPPQINSVLANGKPSVLMKILKNGNASTLDVVTAVKKALVDVRAAAPKDLKIQSLFDQSVFVSSAISEVLQEAVIAAGLTGLTILLFLGSWRSTIVVLISIPLSILTSLAILAALGETINTMTLGGLALAVGILVDDATVAIENTYRLFEEGHPFRDSVAEGAAGIAKPALISTLSICAAFTAVFALTDTPKYLFQPQALAVVFAMLTSYVLSRTLVPVLIDSLVETEYDAQHAKGSHRGAPKHARLPERTRIGRILTICKPLFVPLAFVGRPVGRLGAAFRNRFEAGFSRCHRGYIGLLHVVIGRPKTTMFGIAGVFAFSAVLLLFVGQDYFPAIEADQLTLHIRTRPGMRIETATRVFREVENVVRQTIPPENTGLILDNIGLPAVNYNFAFSDGSFVAYNDGQMLINLKGDHEPASAYQARLREVLHEKFPNDVFYFQPSDIITQILDFGTIAQIDVQVAGRHTEADYKAAKVLANKLTAVHGAVDVHVQQIMNVPEFFVDIDRRLASELNLTEQQAAQQMNISLSGSFQVNPNFWVDPKNGIPYQLWVQTPEWRNSSMNALKTTPIFAQADGDKPGVVALLASIATVTRRPIQTVINHVNTEPTFDVLANTQDADLGSVRGDITKIVAEVQKTLQAPDKIVIRGQIASMDSAFSRLEIGLGIALVAVYLLMAINFQSWGDPFVVLIALPIAFCGIIMSLFITSTTFSIPSLFGAIMSVGVASANSILLVTFAKEHREATGCGAVEAAIAAGETRLRPVLMTASAMFVGLIPMAIGAGEGGEQNAALARAVLGGIAAATCSTLILVPFFYSLLRRGEVKPLEDYT